MNSDYSKGCKNSGKTSCKKTRFHNVKKEKNYDCSKDMETRNFNTKFLS